MSSFLIKFICSNCSQKLKFDDELFENNEIRILSCEDCINKDVIQAQKDGKAEAKKAVEDLLRNLS